MDGEYIQYLKQEAAASANRIISRVVVMSIYGMVGVYLLSTIMSGVVPMVAAILPLGSCSLASWVSSPNNEQRTTNNEHPPMNLTTYLRAGYPGVALVSPEEARAESEIAAVCAAGTRPTTPA